MMPTPRLTLKRLKYATDSVLQSARRLRNSSLKDEAVNWADLFCSSAEYRVDDEGHEYYAVKVEEADPSASKLAQYVHAGLKKRGYVNVAVETEW